MRSELMRRAVSLACDSASEGGGPFGALIVRDGQIVAEGSNKVTMLNDPTAHAEIVAVRAACFALGRFDLRGCEIYTSCEPCPMCLGAVHWARVSKIYYCATRHDAARVGFDDAALYDEFTRPLEARTTPIIRLVSAEANSPFEVWMQQARRIAY